MQVPRILHSRVVHRGQEADVPILPREGRPEADVPEPLGEAAHDVRAAARLAEVARVLAAHHTRPRAGHQLGPRTGVTQDGKSGQSHGMTH